MPTAIVTGATGILGREIVSALGKDPDTWTAVHALSRSQKEKYPPNVKHDRLDLTGDVGDMAGQLQGVEAEYVFFSAYLEKESAEELCKVNGAMLRNFLEALRATGAIKQLKRVVLVTGAKQYGVHYGRVKTPMVESDPRIPETSPWGPNFYYTQQDILGELSASASWDWVVTYPNDVVGTAFNNFMNLCTSLGIYAAVSREMTNANGGGGDGGELFWPGNETFYRAATTFTSSKLHADFCLWAALEPRCSNQAFNVVNGDVESYQSLWPRIAEFFGCRIPRDQFSSGRRGRKGEGNGGGEGGIGPFDEDLSTRVKLADKPPISEWADRLGLVGSEVLAPTYLEARIDPAKWSQQAAVRQAWDRLAERHGLEKDALDKATWPFLFFQLGRTYDVVISMTKARELGWSGYVDTWKSFVEVFEELQEAKVLPKLA